MAYKRITVSLTEDRYERVQELCDEMGMSMSQVVNWIIQSWDDMLSSVQSDSYAKYGQLVGEIEHLIKRYDMAEEQAVDKEQKCNDEGMLWGEGYFGGKSYVYLSVATDLRLLLHKGNE